MRKSQPVWKDVKGKLSGLDHQGLLGLIRDLYDVRKENREFLHARFGLGADILGSYKQTIQKWIAPDVFSRNHDVSVTKARQAIADYRQASGDAGGVAELAVFYCECASEFSSEFGNDDPVYFRALVQVFGQAVSLVNTLPASEQDALNERLEQVCDICREFGYFVGEEMDDIIGNASI